MWDGRTVRNTRQGRSIKSIQAQVDRALASTAGTDTYYKNYRRLISVAQRYNQNIQNEMARRAANNPNAGGSSALARQLRDPQREANAMLGRNIYEGRNTNGSRNAFGGRGNAQTKKAAKGNSVK